MSASVLAATSQHQLIQLDDEEQEIFRNIKTKFTNAIGEADDYHAKVNQCVHSRNPRVIFPLSFIDQVDSHMALRLLRDPFTYFPAAEAALREQAAFLVPKINDAVFTSSKEKNRVSSKRLIYPCSFSQWTSNWDSQAGSALMALLPEV